MSREHFIPRMTKSEMDEIRSVLNGDGSGFEVVSPGVYRSVKDSEYFDLKAEDVYEFVEERAGGVIIKKK